MADQIMCDNDAEYYSYHQWERDREGVMRCRVCGKEWRKTVELPDDDTWDDTI